VRPNRGLKRVNQTWVILLGNGGSVEDAFDVTTDHPGAVVEVLHQEADHMAVNSKLLRRLAKQLVSSDGDGTKDRGLKACWLRLSRAPWVPIQFPPGQLR
jgi:hypothetical protein